MRAAGVLLNSSREAGERGFSTVATTLKRLEKFRAFAKEIGVNRLDKIEPEHVRAYAAELRKSSLSPSYQQNLLSAVNSVMKLGHERLGSFWETVSARAEGLPTRDNVRTEPTSTREQLRQALPSMPERAAAVAILARDLGLRSKEASLLNCKKALHQAQTSGLLRIESGTKGGRAREIPITSPEQLQSLAAAAHLQGNCRNLIPKGETWAGFRADTLLKGRDSLKKHGIAAYHDLRAAYAADRYQDLTGHPAPCNAAAHRAADRTADQAARMLISKELGHGRTDVLVSYVGSSR